LKLRFALFLLALPLLMPAVARSQKPSSGQAAATDQHSKPDSEESLDADSETDAFRHPPLVQAWARKAHLSTDTTSRILEDLNSGILIAVILWFVFRTVPKVMRKRNETLQKQLFDARLATTQANERLEVVEERLSKLGIEIESIREQTERDSVGDKKRIQESLEVERQRIVASAEQEIEAAGAAARRDLKKFAAELAIDRARQGIHLGAEGDKVLIHSFGEKLKAERN
jgi:F-type H+-transporting ATPase subunit b